MNLTNDQEKALLDALCWNIHIFKILGKNFSDAKNHKWADIMNACRKQNVAMAQMLIPNPPVSSVPPELQAAVPSRRMMQIEVLEKLFDDSPGNGLF